jgi:Flp pilus assembly pilin Flp
MTEYLIILALVAVAAIIMVSVFGKQVKIAIDRSMGAFAGSSAVSSTNSNTVPTNAVGPNPSPPPVGTIVPPPATGSPAAVLLVLAAMFSAIAWSAKRSVSVLENRYHLFILEQLSKGRPMTRHELRKVIIEGNSIFLYRIDPSIYTDAMATLLREGKIHLDDGRYFMQVQQAPQTRSAKTSKSSVHST